MPSRDLPVRPDLDQLKHQAKDLLRALRGGDPGAIADLRLFHPEPVDPGAARLADAQLVLARGYQAPSWARLVQACRLIDAIWDDDLDTVRELVTRYPNLLHENAGIRNNNWGPPLSYAANLGRDRIITTLHQLGARDLEHALDRAVLQSRIETARLLYDLLGRPTPPPDYLGGAAYTLSPSGTKLMLELGVPVRDQAGRTTAPIHVVLESDSRKPAEKHAILEMYAQYGATLPDTPMMALHRGRIDLLEAHLRQDPGLLARTFRFDEIFPRELGCQGESFPRTPLDGATLLHVAVEMDELDIARWLLDRGMAVDAPAATDADGFGGHTALFSAVVSYPNFWMNYTGGWAHSRKPQDSPFARLLLERRADPNARASLRERVTPDASVSLREHRDLTPIAWGRRFHNPIVVSKPAMQLIADHGGHE